MMSSFLTESRVDLAADPEVVPVSGSQWSIFQPHSRAAHPGADPWRRSKLLRDWAGPVPICRSFEQIEEKPAADPRGFSTPLVTANNVPTRVIQAIRRRFLEKTIGE